MCCDAQLGCLRGFREGYHMDSVDSTPTPPPLPSRYLCEVPHKGEGVATPLWHQHTLFLATQSSVLAVFPNHGATVVGGGGGGGGRLSSGKGRGSNSAEAGATVLVLASHTPPRPPRRAMPGIVPELLGAEAVTSIEPPSRCVRVGGAVPLTVLRGRLVVGVWTGESGRPAVVPLHAPLVRMGMLIMAGHPEKAVAWVGALPTHLHDAAARFLAVRCVFRCATVCLPMPDELADCHGCRVACVTVVDMSL